MHVTAIQSSWTPKQSHNPAESCCYVSKHFDEMAQRCGYSVRSAAALSGSAAARSSWGRKAWTHQSRIPRALLFVAGGNPLHADHFAKQIFILPLVALLFLTRGGGQLLLLTGGGKKDNLLKKTLWQEDGGRRRMHVKTWGLDLILQKLNNVWTN